MATLIYVSLSGMAPPYLAADCQLVSDDGRRQLRSTNSRTCVVRRTCSSYEYALLLQILGCGTVCQLI